MATTQSKRARVLVVDDSRVMRKAIEGVLASKYDLVEAGDGEAGWDLLRKNPDIEVVISDIQMPKLDGCGMVCRIRAADNAKLAGLPIIVITGAEDEVTKERAFACGCDDFITKPVDPAQLLAALQGYTGAKTKLETNNAGIDPLTHVANRTNFLDKARKLFSATQNNGDMLSVVRIDVDDFEYIRTKYGDDIADQVLIWVSKKLSDKARNNEIVGQLGRTQFSILAFSPGRMGVAALCDRFRTAISAKPFEQGGKSVSVTLSIGLATANHDPADSIEELIDLANQRSLVARSRGVNQLVVSDKENSAIQETIMEEPNIETVLQILAGTKNGSFDPYAIDPLTRTSHHRVL